MKPLLKLFGIMAIAISCSKPVCPGRFTYNVEDATSDSSIFSYPMPLPAWNPQFILTDSIMEYAFDWESIEEWLADESDTLVLIPFINGHAFTAQYPQSYHDKIWRTCGAHSRVVMTRRMSDTITPVYKEIKRNSRELRELLRANLITRRS